MKTGNQAQAVILGVVAVGAIGFLVTRLMPAKVPPALAADGPERTTKGATALLDGFPTEVTRDAFSHPALAKRAEVLKQIDMHSPETTSNAQTPAELFLNGPIALPKPERQLIVEPDVAKTEGDKPSGITEKDQQEDKKPQLKFALKAIMRATKSIAIMSLDGQPEVIVSPGDQLTATYKVGRFSATAVQIVSPKDKFWINVGTEVSR